MTDLPALQPSIALAAYAEPVASGRRALVFGSARSALAEQLIERGARVVHVCDSDALSVAEASAKNRSQHISFSALTAGDLGHRDGAFDLVIIENLGAFDALSVLRKARRALSPRGILLAACPNPEASFPLLPPVDRAATALDYYALYDAVAAEFQHVRMLGQTPFVGYAIADFSSAQHPEPALDTGFVPGGAEEPDLFIALAATHAVKLEEFSVIQLPTRRLLKGTRNRAEALPGERTRADRVRDGERKELERLNHWITELEARAATADERADQAESELEDLRSQSDATAKEPARDFNGELTTLRAELARRDTELESKAQEVVRMTQEIARFTQELAQKNQLLAERDALLLEIAGRAEQDSKPELETFEGQLHERGAEIRRLERELRTAERLGRELVREFERRRIEAGPEKQSELERALAEREANLVAAEWTIDALAVRLEHGQAAMPTFGHPHRASS
jgi:SAM-dependent methyltransferase